MIRPTNADLTPVISNAYRGQSHRVLSQHRRRAGRHRATRETEAPCRVSQRPRRGRESLTEAIATMGASSAIVTALKEREARLQELRASLDAVADRPNARHLNVNSIRRKALRQVSEWKGLLAQNVAIARQILRQVLERRLVFVPRHEGDEHW